MAIRQDYIERMIQKLAETIARALGIARSGQHEEGLTLVEDAVASGFGLPLSMLLGLTPETVRSLIGEERVPALVEALRAYIEMSKLAGRGAEARASERLVNALDKGR
ncbi:MAG TPA: hypothetical protein VNN72_14735 [Polyangiaceae bacterium]|nr:hypothetical protein [Polyangiaceae bacterium]